MTLEELRIRFQAITDAVEGPDGPHVAHAMADECKAIVQTLLSVPGRSAPGAPPGLHTGFLRESVIASPGVGGGGTGEAFCGATARYAAIQETGGTIFPQNRRFLHWRDERGSMYLKSVTLPPRPYMRPARRLGIETGAFQRAAMDAFRADTAL